MRKQRFYLFDRRGHITDFGDEVFRCVRLVIIFIGLFCAAYVLG